MTQPDVIEVAVTCEKCGTTVHNDKPDIRHPLEFLAAMRALGWQAYHGVNKPVLCDKCVSLS